MSSQKSVLFRFIVASIVALYFIAINGCRCDPNNGNVVFRTYNKCELTNWSEWSECSATCGIGVMTKTRRFLSHIGYIKCNNISTMQKKKCVKQPCTTLTRNSLIQEKPNCTTTEWSNWSSCSALCGSGMQIRIRYFTAPHLAAFCEPEIALQERRECIETEKCVIHKEKAKETCHQDYDLGLCRGSFPRWYFDKKTKKCTPFSYGGCEGNKNNFWTKEQCDEACSALFGS